MRIGFLILLVVIVAGCKNQTTEQVTAKPNVLLLYMDDLRPELATYGAQQILSPHIDALAASGTKFTNAYCNIPVCGASRASMLTGMLPTRNRFLNYDTFVEKETPQAVTLPQLFKENGYTTISNGKIYHHLDDRENDWDEVWRPYAFEPNDKNLAPTDRWQSLWKDYQRPENIEEYKKTNTGPAYEMAPVADSVYIDGLMTEKVIKDLKKLKKSEKPFFLTAGFIAPHLPFNAPQKYWDLYDRNQIQQPENYNYIPENAPQMSISKWPEMRAYSNIPKTGQVSDSVAVDLIHGYYATVSYTDALIGKILKELKAQKLDQNTIVVLVADHGYNLQEHTQWAKFTNYRTSTQVPFIISYPKELPQNQVTNALVDLTDVYPTLASLCHLKTPDNQLAGNDLSPALRGDNYKGKDAVLIKKGNAYTIQTTRYSYTAFIKKDSDRIITSMLYDHKNDPEENMNVVDDPAFAKVRQDLQYQLFDTYGESINPK